MVAILAVPHLSYGQTASQKVLAQRFATMVQVVQNVCIEKAKVECELVELTDNPPMLFEGQVIDYLGVRARGVVYLYAVIAERDDMDPDIYIYDSAGKLLARGDKTGPVDMAAHVPEYKQRVIQRIKMFKGSGRIALAVMAPIGD
jgi:hypothetical protein